MHTHNPSPRIAVLAHGTARRDFLVLLCQTGVPGARVDALHDMFELMLRAAAGSVDAVVFDGDSPACLPEEGAAVLKGLRSTIIVVLADHDGSAPVPPCVDFLLGREQLPGWLAATFIEAARTGEKP